MDKIDLAKFREQSAESVRQRVGLIKAELESGLAFARLAQTEYSLTELVSDSPTAFAGANQAFANARTSYEVVLRYLPEIELSEQDTQEVQEKLKLLEQLFDRMSKAMRIANPAPEDPLPHLSRVRSSKRRRLRHSKKR
jgi:hypothetical protein